MAQHIHDCDDCIFLGVFVEYDLYFHKTDVETTVLARRSSNGPDYLSGLEFARRGIHPPLVEALARAKTLGLIE